MIKTLKITSVVAVFILIISLIFKSMHWPGASLLLLFGTATAILLFILLLFTIPSKLSGGWEKISFIVTSLTLIAALSAFSFKVLHLPGAGILIWIADISILCSMILILIDGLLEKDSQKIGLKIIVAFFAMLILLMITLIK